MRRKPDYTVTNRSRASIRGVSAVEYIAIVGLVALGGVGALKAYGDSVGAKTEVAAERVRTLTGKTPDTVAGSGSNIGLGGTPPPGSSECAGGTCGRTDSSCFVAGTPVRTREGSAPIESIRAGDRVASRDPVTGEVSFERVVRTFINIGHDLIDLDLEAVDASTETIRSTGDHPYWTLARGWQRADRLTTEDVLVDAEGRETRVVATHALPMDVPVFNIEVERTHTYFAGVHGIWVHNASCTSIVPPEAEEREKLEAYARAVEAVETIRMTSGRKGGTLEKIFAGRRPQLPGEIWDRVGEHLGPRESSRLHVQHTLEKLSPAERERVLGSYLASAHLEKPGGETWSEHVVRVSRNTGYPRYPDRLGAMMELVGPINERWKTIAIVHGQEDRDIAKYMVSRDWWMMEHLTAEQRDDRDIAVTALRANGSLAFASQRLRNDPELAKLYLDQIQENDAGTPDLQRQFGTMGGEVRRDVGVARRAAQLGMHVLSDPESRIWTDRETVKSQFQKFGAGQSGFGPYADDYEMVDAAVRASGQSLNHASPTLKNTKSIAMAAIENDGDERKRKDGGYRGWREPPALAYASTTLSNDPEVVMAAVQRNARALEHASDLLRDDPAIVRAAVDRRGNALQFASDRLRDDHAIVLAAVQKEPQSLQFASERLRGNAEILRAAIAGSPDAYFRWASGWGRWNPLLLAEAMHDPQRNPLPGRANAYRW